MRSIDEQVLKVTKEIVAKFIEVGRVSPGTFDDTFKNVYRSIKEAVVENGKTEEFLKGLHSGVVMLSHDADGTGQYKWRGIAVMPEGEFCSEANDALAALQAIAEQVHERRN